MIWLWVGFILAIVGLLTLDLGVLHRRGRVMHPKEALAWTGFWVALALAFNVVIYAIYEYDWLGTGQSLRTNLSGRQAALEFFAGYLVEESLSVDNLFIIAVIFGYFRVPPIYQHRVLFWGIIGAMLLRGIMISLGAALFHLFDWVVYVFGGFLILTAIKLLVVRQDNLEPDRNPLVRLARRLYPVSANFEGERFFTRINGQHAITPLFLVLLVVESTDLMFAVDSIPAIFAVTQDPFLVFTSNVFAILGLRSLYFALAGIMEKFRYLKISLVFVLAFVGIKMLLSHHHPIPTVVSLSFIVGILGVGCLASIWANTGAKSPLGEPVVEAVPPPGRLVRKQARRIMILVVGSTALIWGFALAVWPEAGILLIVVGVVILGLELIWGRRQLHSALDPGGTTGGGDQNHFDSSRSASDNKPPDGAEKPTTQGRHHN